jgi:hypothetical protein
MKNRCQANLEMSGDEKSLDKGHGENYFVDTIIAGMDLL